MGRHREFPRRRDFGKSRSCRIFAKKAEASRKSSSLCFRGIADFVADSTVQKLYGIKMRSIGAPHSGVLTKSARWQTMTNEERLFVFVLVGVRVYGRGQKRAKAGLTGIFARQSVFMSLSILCFAGFFGKLLFSMFLNFHLFSCRSGEFVSGLTPPAWEAINIFA